MRRSLRFLAVLACALPLACSDTSTAPTAPPPVPSLSANPASNGSVVVRWNDWAGWMWVGWYDPGLDVIGVFASGDIPALCAGQAGAFLPSDWKYVASGRFEDLYHSIATFPEMYLFIYDGGWTTFDLCTAPIMRGMGTARLTDNDRNPYGVRAGNGANAWGFMASGQVTDANGQAYRFSGHVRGVNGPDGSYREETTMNLQPLP